MLRSQPRSGNQWALALLGGLILAPPIAAGDLDDIKARGRLVVLCHPIQSSPFARADLEALRTKGLKLTELRDPDDFEGVDIDLMRAFSAHLGVTLEVRAVVDLEPGLLDALLSRQGDIVASGILMTAERRRRVDFSDPYLQTWSTVLTPLASGISNLTDLKGKRGAVVRGAHLETFRGLTPEGITVRSTEFQMETYAAVLEGEADFAVMASAAPVGQPDPDFPEVKVAFRLGELLGGFAVRPGSDLLEPLNDWLAATMSSGGLHRAFDEHQVLKSARASVPSRP